MIPMSLVVPDASLNFVMDTSSETISPESLMLRETIILAWREIRGHLMRSSLTTLGIIIGVSAVIAILTVSDGLKARITKELSGIGGNLLTLRPGQTRGDSVASFAQPFRPEDVAAL